MLIRNQQLSAQTINFTTNGKSRIGQMEGRDWLVVPMVMMTEGVHAGSSGPLYYPASEMERAVAVWNHKPVVVYHPTDNSGQGVSACDPDIVTKYKVGVIMNMKFRPAKGNVKAAWVAEAWLDQDRLEIVDKRVLEAIEADKVLELSTGLFTDNEEKTGEWAGKKYAQIARNYQPDHLAILPDKKGACSVEDGAGFLRLNESLEELDEATAACARGMLGAYLDKQGLVVFNGKSFGDIQGDLYTLLRERYGDGYWVMDVFDKTVIYSDKSGQLWQRGWTADGDSVTLTDADPVKVKRVSNYKPTQNEEPEMTKDLMVAALIGNAKSGWTEADKPALLLMPDASLKRLVDNMKETKEPEAAAGGTSAAPATTAPATSTQPGGAVPAVAPTDNMTVEQYLQKAPPAIQGVLAAGLRANEAAKDAAIKTITANAQNKFTPEYLKTLNVDQLQGMAALAAPAPAAPVANGYSPYPEPIPMYFGAAGAPAAPTVNAAPEEAPLPRPQMTFDKAG